jgi:hypothetical protein
MNKTVAVAFSQSSKILHGLLLIIIAPLFLTTEQQGYWFLMLSFGNLLILITAAQASISVVFIPYQLNKKNATLLKWHPLLEERVLTYINYSFKKFIHLLFYIVVTILIGWIFIAKNHIISFCIYLIGLILYFTIHLFLGYLEGINEVTYVNKIKGVYFILFSLLSSFFIWLKFELNTLGISAIIASLIIILVVLRKHKSLITTLLTTNQSLSTLSHKKPLNIYMKNNIINMLSGFFLFQAYTPVVFYFYGSELAGKVGLSLGLFSAVFSISTIWMISFLPAFHHLLSNGNKLTAYTQYVFRSKLAIATYISLGGGILFIMENKIIPPIFHIDFTERTLDNQLLTTLFFCWLLQLIVYLFVAFIRGFRREKFVVLTVSSSLYVLFITIITGVINNQSLIFLGFLTSYFYAIPIIYSEFRKFKYKIYFGKNHV